MDLYAYHVDGQRLMRLTNLEALDDPINRPAAEKDERQKQYLEPSEGIGEFDISRDGARAGFSYHGDLYLVSTSGGETPFRLTRTKAAETNPAFFARWEQAGLRARGAIVHAGPAHGPALAGHGDRWRRCIAGRMALVAGR